MKVLKTLLVSWSETLLSISLALLFAVFFLGILVVAFPQGTGLVDFYGELVDQQSASRDRSRHAVDWIGDAEDGPAAFLTSIDRKVRDRPADAIAWSYSRPGTPLEDRHTIQTMARSGASITFRERDELQLAENSLVVIKRSSDRRRGRRREPSLVLLGGKVRGRVAPGGAAAAPLDVVTPGGATRVGADGDEPGEFAVTVNPDSTTTVSLFSGTAEVTSAGQTVEVGANQSITLVPSEPPGEPQAIPEPPVLSAPADGSARTFGTVLPRVDFQWNAEVGIDRYRLVVAEDPEFESVVFSSETEEAEFTHGNLAAGRYFWRVSALRGGAESEFSRISSFALVQDGEPPELRVDLPDDVVASDRLVLRGSTEPGCRVFVDDQPVSVESDGAFEYALELGPGLNMVVIEVVDPAGNSAYRTGYVTARF